MAGQGMDEEFRCEIFKNAKQLHGVFYLGRYGYVVEEVLEMERLLHALASEKRERNVLSLLHHDPNASFYDNETVGGLSADGPDGVCLNRVAADHLFQFHLFGAAGQMVPFADVPLKSCGDFAGTP
ncbi:hypothetical protein AXX04_29230 [Pseudomonas aeruginosa]|nr:hypothetical protein AXX04_29230 [Pseudomonas aeruginosa]